VAILTLLVSIKEVPKTDKVVLHMTQREGKEPLRKEQLKNLIRTEHLNKEEKKALERICEEFYDIFYLENALICTTANRIKLIRVQIARR